MYLVCYLAHDDADIPAVQERLALAEQSMGLVTAGSVPELISRVQTLPIRALVVDSSWPRAVWTQLKTELRAVQWNLPVYAVAAGATEMEWWRVADDLLRLDEDLDLFLFRLAREAKNAGVVPVSEYAASVTVAPVAPPSLGPPPFSELPGLLEIPQFRQFAEIFTGLEEAELVETFIAWVQSACQTSRAVILLRNEQSGVFECRAHRGLSSAIVPHCAFAQTAPICRWLATTNRILLREYGATNEMIDDLELIQAVAAVPILFDGQLVGILGLGPRIVGNSFNSTELEGLYAIAGQIAVALHHCRMHRTIRRQQEMTEHMLEVMPTGAIVLNADQRIAFVNASAAAILGKTRAALQGMDLRALPSPLGDMAYESIVSKRDLPRRELQLAPSGHPVAVMCFILATSTPSAMLLVEDRSAQKRLEEERERRVDLEVVTNLVHYLAHELCNPLVTLSTFSNLVPSRAGDADFEEFCDSVLQPEIGRVNLILEQLLVLTHHAEYQFTQVDLGALLERVTGVEELRSLIVTSIPPNLPVLQGDAHRLETAVTCLMRTVVRLGNRETPATMRVEADERQEAVVISIELPTSEGLAPEWLLNPWQQLMGGPEQHVDLGVATAQYIMEQHQGTLNVSQSGNVLYLICRLPLRAEKRGGEDVWHDAKESARRR
jgi:nitrogen-specific signal transduction histidine kinase